MKGGINYVRFNNSKPANEENQQHLGGFDLLGFIRQPNDITSNGIYPCIEWQWSKKDSIVVQSLEVGMIFWLSYKTPTDEKQNTDKKKSFRLNEENLPHNTLKIGNTPISVVAKYKILWKLK